MEVNNQKRSISNKIDQNIKAESSQEYQNINNQENIPEIQSSSGVLTFIKTKPVLFSMIVIGACVVITLAITLPLVLIKEEKTDEKPSNNNQNEGPNIIEIDSTKHFIFSDIAITSEMESNCDSLNNCCTYLSDISDDLDDKNKVHLIYKWVAENIVYDYDNYKEGNEVSCEPQDVFSNKKGVCSGYAKLFTKLLTCLNFPAENIKNIIGHSKGLGFNYEVEISDENTDHEWNAVKIGDKWCLIDTTWGAGSIIGEAFEKSYDEYYLCTPPAQFVRTHLPKKIEENLQFLDKPISINTFQNMAFTTKYFFEYGFNGLSNDKMVQNIK